MQESQTTFIKELLTDNKVVGKELTQQNLRDLWHLLKYLNGLPHLPLVYKPNSLQL
jgi:hypothetical protein